MATDHAHIECPACGRSYRLKPEMAGRRFKCKCGGVIAAPAPPPPASAPAHEMDYDALAGLGTGTQVDAPPPPPPAYAPWSKPRRERSTSGGGVGGGGAGRWFKGGLAAIFSRDHTPRSREQHIVQYWFWGAGFVIAGLACILVCRYAEQRHAAFMAKAQKTTAMVAKAPAVRKEGRGARALDSNNWYYTFPVVFKVDGQDLRQDIELRGNRLPPNLNRDDTTNWVRQELTVYYDPANPSNVKAASAAESSNWFWGYLVGGVFAALGAWGLLTRWPY
jgi:hypothetical protein